MKQFQEGLIELETEAEHLLLAHHQVFFLNSLLCFGTFCYVAKKVWENTKTFDIRSLRTISIHYFKTRL